MNEIQIPGCPYVYSESQARPIRELAGRVMELRKGGTLTPKVLYRIRKYFRIKNIYHSNAIEGNLLDEGETRQVVELGMTITGKSLRDQAEAKNLGEAIDFLEGLVTDTTRPITESDVRQIHHFVLKGIDEENAGAYRRVPVLISGSEHAPPGPESVPVEMALFGVWLAGIQPDRTVSPVDGILAAAVAHTWFVSNHPFIDGNGRVARLLMNLVLMRFGIPVAVVTREDRMRYYDALEDSRSSDLSGFLSLLCECIHESLEEYERAAAEQQEQAEWVRSIAVEYGSREIAKNRNEYEVWRSAMDLLLGYMRQTAQEISKSVPNISIFVKDFGHLDFERYVRLRNRKSAKRTWFFRVDCRRGDEPTVRYLFFFGYASKVLGDRCRVTLRVSREERPGNFFYELLDDIRMTNVPAVRELGHSPKEERFVFRNEGNRMIAGKLEVIGKRFYGDVLKKHFGS